MTLCVRLMSTEGHRAYCPAANRKNVCICPISLKAFLDMLYHDNSLRWSLFSSGCLLILVHEYAALFCVLYKPLRVQGLESYIQISFQIRASIRTNTVGTSLDFGPETRIRKQSADTQAGSLGRCGHSNHRSSLQWHPPQRHKVLTCPHWGPRKHIWGDVFAAAAHNVCRSFEPGSASLSVT